jgi:hypothetical protein
LLHQAESVLPGIWHIESVQLPKYGLGITYRGQKFYRDTVLNDVGTFEIDHFKTDTLELYKTKVRCDLFLDGEHFPYSLNHLIISGGEIFSYFRMNVSDGIHTIDTPGKAFVFSSYIFNNNYVVQIVDHDHVLLLKANHRDGHVISLVRAG